MMVKIEETQWMIKNQLIFIIKVENLRVIQIILDSRDWKILDLKFSIIDRLDSIIIRD